jgi:hypothetical protein
MNRDLQSLRSFLRLKRGRRFAEIGRGRLFFAGAAAKNEPADRHQE